MTNLLLFDTSTPLLITGEDFLPQFLQGLAGMAENSHSMSREGLTDYYVTLHAEFEMLRRGIDRGMLQSVLQNPDQRFELWKGREVFQSKIMGMEVMNESQL